MTPSPKSRDPQPDPATTIGIDFGGTSVKIGACRDGEIVGRAEPIPTAKFAGADPLIAEIVDRVAGLRSEFPAVSALGAGVPGLVDAGRSNDRREPLQDRLHSRGILAVFAMVSRQIDGVRCQTIRLGDGHSRSDAKLAHLVAGRRNDAAVTW